MKYLSIVLVIILSVSCVKKGLENKQSNNSEFEIALLFEYDSCRVYRFYDGGYSRYFTNCKGSTQWRESAGKTSRSMEVVGGK